MKKLIILALLGTYLFSGSFVTSVTKISSLNVYNGTSRAGDIIFRVENPHENCYGYYVGKDDIGSKQTLSVVLSAFHAKTDLRVYSITGTPTWPGSSNKYCQVSVIRYE